MTDCSIRIYGAAALASLLASTAVAQTAPPAPLPAGYAGRDPVRSEWPVQVRQSLGQVAPQDPATLPRSRAPLSKPVAKPAPGGPALTQRSPGLWTVAGWRLAEAPDVKADGATVSRAGYDAKSWYVATVPGTEGVLLVFDDFLKGLDAYGTRIQPLMASRAHIAADAETMAKVA